MMRERLLLVIPNLPQVFPANQNMRSNKDSRGDLWVMKFACIHALLVKSSDFTQKPFNTAPI
jgi:TFIIF-interacting CTD phosphatase-like protein